MRGEKGPIHKETIEWLMINEKNPALYWNRREPNAITLFLLSYLLAFSLSTSYIKAK